MQLTVFMYVWLVAPTGSLEVKRVPDPGCKTQAKIRAVKHWLTQAERHYGVNAPVRGQMELLIAEAELRSTRNELEAICKWRLQAIAFGLACILTVAGISGFWWTNRTISEESTRTMPTIPAPVSAVEEHKLAPPASKVESPVATGVDANNSVQEVKTTETVTPVTAPQTALSPEEMKRLVQAAGQSLRGRTKP